MINDQLSKFIQIYPIKDTAKTASKCLIDYCLRFGMPVKLYLDRDPRATKVNYSSI